MDTLPQVKGMSRRIVDNNEYEKNTVAKGNERHKTQTHRPSVRFEILKSNLEAVSYTHLDVYKRQV